MSLVPSIKVEGREVAVASLYDAKFVEAARGLGGRWDREKALWLFPLDVLDGVRAALREVYLVDPLAGPPDLVDVLVTLRGNLSHDAIRVAGRELLVRPARDSAVRPGPEVAIVERGQLMRSGGSAKYPAIGPADGVVMLVRALPRAAVELLKGREYVAEVEIVAGEPGDTASAAIVESCLSALACHLPRLGEAEREKAVAQLREMLAPAQTGAGQ